jgi:hypothetical protein
MRKPCGRAVPAPSDMGHSTLRPLRGRHPSPPRASRHRDTVRAINDGVSAFGAKVGRPSVDLGQRQRSHWRSRYVQPHLRRLPSPFSSANAKKGSPPCIRGSVFRSSQRQLPGLLLASCWGLQVSLSIQRQPRRSCTASTLNIRPAALPGQASCSGLVRWHALRSVITPVAT